LPEQRLDRLSPQEVEERLAHASVAYVPIGSLEFHGPHLPMGVDMFTAQGLCIEAAQISGGIVLPPVFIANGCLDLPHTLTFDPGLVEAWTRAVVEQLHHRGVAVVVLVTGHGPLDLIHLLKRVAAETDQVGARAYGLCWLELNAAQLEKPETGEPTVIDHASTIETSWMLALEPELVHLGGLPDDPDAAIIGVYGRNPRFTASAEGGWDQITACAQLLSQRVGRMIAGTWTDSGQDLARFVEHAWPEPLTGTAWISPDDPLVISLENPGRASRYLSGVHEVLVKGSIVDLTSAWCANLSVGETGVRTPLDSLTRERGIYIRRGQSLQMVIPGCQELAAGHEVELVIELGGVLPVRLKITARDTPNSHGMVSDLDEGDDRP
jgi:creatinine amidohydrolase